MAPARRPLSITIDQPIPNLIEIFNNSQHVTSSDTALNQLKKLHKITTFAQFEGPFRECVKKLFQSKQTIYFKTSCEFLCKFLQYLSKLSDESKAKGDVPTLENTAPSAKSNRRVTRSSFSPASSATTQAPAAKKRGRPARKGTKRKASASSEDELVSIIIPNKNTTVQEDNSDESNDELVPQSVPKKRHSMVTSITPITDYDRIISSVIDVADLYMQVSDEECRLNAVFFICKFLSHVESLDEEICDALKSTLPKRIRDRKPMIRAQAVLASRTFQQSKLTQEGFKHHFERDPELVVRKALLQIMDTAVFGYDFIVDSTQDFHAVMRKAAFQRVGKLLPSELSPKHIHQVIRNGLNERDRQASYAFKANTLEPWLKSFYDGLDLVKLLQSFEILSNHNDICRLLQLIYERNLEELINNGTTTKLHQVVENFRENWLNYENLCLPYLEKLDEKNVTIWITLVNFCKKNQSIIKPVRLRAVEPPVEDPNESIERILDSQNVNDDVIELYERLTPDLVNLVDFLKRFVQFTSKAVQDKNADFEKLEFVYQQLMTFISGYEIGDELERKTVQEVLGSLLKENLLTGRFVNYILPIVKCLFKLIYSSSSNLMINYFSEIINNVRSHLEDLSASTKQQQNVTHQPAIDTSEVNTRSAKKAKIDQARRNSRRYDLEQHKLEYNIATIRFQIQELNDKFDDCIKEKDFDEAKIINNKIENLKEKFDMLHARRCSIASDVSHMSLVVENEPTSNSKFSSTMIGDTSMTDTQASTVNKDDVKIFKHHRNELLKCLQMYLGCLQSVEINSVPQTMLNHLAHLSYESLDEWFKEDTKVRSLMIACNGITALVDKEVAMDSTTTTLLLAACFDKESIEVRTEGFKNLTDILCQHSEIEISMDKVEKFLNLSLSEYGKYNPKDVKANELEFLTTIVEGTTKLLYLKKLSSPQILTHLIIWWYHPKTHSKLKQYIGIFLPTFVNDLMKDQLATEDKWLMELLEETFVTSVEFLHEYILGPGFNIMAASDIHNLINFLCNLIPISLHSTILAKVEERMDELPEGREDLFKYLKQAKNSLASSAQTLPTPISRPLQQID